MYERPKCTVTYSIACSLSTHLFDLNELKTILRGKFGPSVTVKANKYR